MTLTLLWTSNQAETLTLGGTLPIKVWPSGKGVWRDVG